MWLCSSSSWTERPIFDEGLGGCSSRVVPLCQQCDLVEVLVTDWIWLAWRTQEKLLPCHGIRWNSPGVSYISYIKPATEGEQPLEAASRNRTPTPSWSWNKMRSSWLARFHLGMLLRHGNQATSILFPQEQLLFASGLLLDLFVWGPFYWDRIEVLGLIYPLAIEHSYLKWHIEIVDLLINSMVSIPEIGDFPTVLPCWLVTIPRSLRGWIPLATPSQTSRGDLAGFDLWLEFVSNFWKPIFYWFVTGSSLFCQFSGHFDVLRNLIDGMTDHPGLSENFGRWDGVFHVSQGCPKAWKQSG